MTSIKGLAESYRKQICKTETLINLIYLYKDEIPDALYSVAKKTADSEEFEINLNGFMQGDNTKTNYYIIDGEKVTKGIRLKSINTLLKRLSTLVTDNDGIPQIIGDSIAISHQYPKQFKAVSGDVVLCEWGFTGD